MTALSALMRRELRLAARVGGAGLTVLLFYALILVVLPFAIGPDTALLADLAPAIVWVAALLAMLTAQDRFFRDDHEDGTLAAQRFSVLPLEAIVAAKMAVHWLTTAAPLIVLTPLAAILLHMSAARAFDVALTLLIGTPALTALGAIGAALTVSLRRGGLIGPVLIVPLSVPILIFGVGAADAAFASARGAAYLYLAAITLVLAAFAPFAAALALRQSED